MMVTSSLGPTNRQPSSGPAIFSALDIEHIADEVEDVGKSETNELERRMAILLAHLLKWHVQPERGGTSWRLTIRGQRNVVLSRLRKTPSLKVDLADPEWWELAWTDAVTMAKRKPGSAIFR